MEPEHDETESEEDLKHEPANWNFRMWHCRYRSFFLGGLAHLSDLTSRSSYIFWYLTRRTDSRMCFDDWRYYTSSYICYRLEFISFAACIVSTSVVVCAPRSPVQVQLNAGFSRSFGGGEAGETQKDSGMVKMWRSAATP